MKAQAIQVRPSAVRSRTMRAVRSTHSKMEDAVSRALWHRGLRLRRNVRNLPGCPDLAVRSRRIAIFLDSCFWHGCAAHYRAPKENADYWQQKRARNVARDRAVVLEYESMGWTVARMWEHQIREDFEASIEKITQLFRETSTERKRVPKGE